MVYYYPFGISKSGQSSSFAVSTISASAAISATIVAYTASHAIVTQSAGAAGPTGPAPTSCGAGPQGPSGSVGLTGTRGPALTGCPSGTKLCANITPPSGYILVCIQPPPGCTVENTICPGDSTTTTTTTSTTTTTTSTTTTPTCTLLYDVTGPFVDSTTACAAGDAADFSVHQSGATYYSEGTCTTLMGTGTPGSGIPSAGFYKRDSDEYYIEFSGGSIITGPTSCAGTTTTTSTTTVVGECYAVSNGGISTSGTISWTDINGTPRSGTLNAGQSTNICSTTTPIENPAADVSITACSNPCSTLCTSLPCGTACTC